LEEGHTRQNCRVYTNYGNYMISPVHELQDIKWKDNGQHLSSRFDLKTDEVPVRAFLVEEYDAGITVVTATRKGQIKLTGLDAYEASRIKQPIAGMGLKDDGRVVSVEITSAKDEDVMLVTRKGMTLRYPVSDINNTGLKAQGVRAMNVKDDDRIILAGLISGETHLTTVSQRGAVKRPDLDLFEAGARAQVGSTPRRGIKWMRHRRVNAALLKNDIDIVLKSAASEFRLNAASIRVSGKYSIGSFVVDENTFGEVTDVIFEYFR